MLQIDQMVSFWLFPEDDGCPGPDAPEKSLQNT